MKFVVLITPYKKLLKPELAILKIECLINNHNDISEVCERYDNKSM